MKRLFTILSFALMSLSLSATHVTLSLTGVTTGSHFYYCSSVVDSVIVYKPAGGGITVWNNGSGYITADSIIVTLATQGYWTCQYGPTSMIEFYINFTSIAPTQPWMATDTTKCTESSIILKGQATNQPDFTYVWNTGSTASQINAVTSGIYAVTVTGVCGTVNDQINVLNHPVPMPNLGPDVVTCDGNTVTLNPGTFAGYAWSTSVSTPTIDVTTDGTYSISVTDGNGCHASDTVTVTFLFPPTPDIKVVTIETDPVSPLYGNNKPTWETNLLNVDSVVIWRETTSTNYEVVGKVAYGTGAFTDDVSSKLRAWTYKIQFQDTCGNLSTLSDYHTTCKVSVNVTVGGFTANWTEYKVEGGAKASLISKYEIYTGELLNALSYLTYVPGSQYVYGPFTFTDSLVVVAAVITTTAKTEVTALSYPIREADTTASIGEQELLTFDIYPNPSNGVFTISAEGNYLVSVFNSSGSLILSEEMAGTKQFNLNITPGLYQIRIMDQKGSIGTKRVIIQ